MTTSDEGAAEGGSIPGRVQAWGEAARSGSERLIPDWLLPHRGEQRWTVVVVILLAAVLQAILPDKFVLRPKTAAPTLEIVLALVLLVRNPGRINEVRSSLRRMTLLMVGVLAATNAVSTVFLVYHILHGTKATAVSILASGASIWVTNVIAYALWYWEFDRGGPAARATGTDRAPDFLFPQMSDARLGVAWYPTFVDYLYVSFTNAATFSPTDTMPLSRWAKLLMLGQAGISMVTVGLVLARAIGNLPT
jgi:hypothetical protein